MFYNGNVDKGKQFIKEALNMDPDNKEFSSFFKNLSKMERIKKEANDLVQSNKLQDAIEKYNECLLLDPTNR